MNVATITMTPEQAAEKLEAYEACLRRVHDDELAAAVEGYRALAEGTPLLDLDEAFRNCPVDRLGRPRLAVARADRTKVYMRWTDRDETVLYSTEAEAITKWNPRFEYHAGLCWRVSLHREHGQRYQVGDHWYGSTLTGFALVPLVPPDVLASRSQLRNHHVLWEVDQWSKTPHSQKPDRDPYLLRHLGGTLCAIVGEWDLTGLERAIMRGRQ